MNVIILELLKEKVQITSSNIPNNIEQKLIDDLVSEAIKNKLPLYNIDTDKLNSINPDLIITQGLCDVCSISENEIEVTLKDKRCILPSKTKIVSLNGTSFDEICSDFLKVGKLVDKEDVANNIVSKAKKTKIQMSTNILIKAYFYLSGLTHILARVIGFQNKLKWQVLSQH